MKYLCKVNIFFGVCSNSFENEKMSALDSLKIACLPKTFKSFKDLAPGEYIVQHFSTMDTIYGKRLRVDLDECYLYLPERFVKSLSEAAVAELNLSPKIMVYTGKDVGNQNRLMLDFQSADNYLTEQFV